MLKTWQTILAHLFSYELLYGFTSDNRTSMTAERKSSRNAEESLLVMLNATARCTQAISKVNWSDDLAFSALLSRLQPTRSKPENSRTFNCCSHLDIPNSVLHIKDLYGIDLRESNLTNSELQATSLILANLKKAKLSGVNLTRANLMATNLVDTDLTKADLRRADLRQANLTRANLKHTDLTDADLTGANLIGANLTHADLTNTDLTGANLIRTNLTKANLTGSIQIRMKLDGAILDGVKGLKKSK